MVENSYRTIKRSKKHNLNLVGYLKKSAIQVIIINRSVTQLHSQTYYAPFDIPKICFTRNISCNTL